MTGRMAMVRRLETGLGEGGTRYTFDSLLVVP